MRPLLAISALLLSSCAPGFVAACRTRCGMYLDSRIPTSVQDGWSCFELQRFEDILLETTAKGLKGGHHTMPQPLTKENLCKKLSGVSLYLQETEAWTNRAGLHISGATQCDFGVVQVGLASSPYQSSLPHEMMHIFQGCYWDQKAQESAKADAVAELYACVQVETEDAKNGEEPDLSSCLTRAELIRKDLTQVGFHAYWDDYGIQAIIDSMEASK